MGYEQSLSIEDEMEEEINKEARATVLSLQSILTKNTPVGNPDLWKGSAPVGYVGGRARSNWFGYTGQAPTAPTDSTNASASTTATSTAVVSAKTKKYPTMGVINNLDYIERLNDGHSSQAPAKFVEAAIDKVTR